ncbi:unnamed protein product [Ranitomeya imitator]|uniref:Uncharacterized protein n=1 Tax=Ranitomeya imitator TaxID=111125 RepID=A0ABN9LHK4_9NEOB|nr:unnamed protein product [Ranitomeya imitator]
MAARRRATPWGDAEVRYLITELDARDYGCHNHREHPVLHKQAVLRRISRGLAQRFGVQRSSTQIRKKLADLQYRSSERLASIRSQSLPHRAPADPEPQQESTTGSSPTTGSPASLRDMGEVMPPGGDARGSGWSLSSSSPDLPGNQIPTLEDLQASHRRMMMTQGTLAEQVKQHGVMLDRFAAAQQQSGSH